MYTFDVQKRIALYVVSLWGLVFFSMIVLCCNHETDCLSCSCCCGDEEDQISFKDPIYIAGSNPYGSLINKIQEKYRVDNFDNNSYQNSFKINDYGAKGVLEAELSMDGPASSNDNLVN